MWHVSMYVNYVCMYICICMYAHVCMYVYVKAPMNDGFSSEYLYISRKMLTGHFILLVIIINL